jgi:nucleoside-diphosphate-sugar epimerase
MVETVCVTGASGYVAAHLVQQLLLAGYHVRATVRSLAHKDKVQHLEKLAEAFAGSLQLVEADLLQDGAFDSAVKGCKFVFHTASPFFIDVQDQQRDLVDPALKGTRNVFNSIIKSKDTVKRVVLTSSVAAVHGNKGKEDPVSGQLYTEQDWNNTSTLDNKEGYWLSKVLAEKEAWEMAKQHGINLLTILPNFVTGPAISTRIDGLSVQFMKSWLEGTAGTGDLTICDVRDVAEAHILAAETPTASGRYIVSNRKPISPKFVAETLQAHFPDLQIPDGQDSDVQETIDNSKAQRELGLCVRLPAITLADMARTLIQLGIAQPKHKG